MEYILFRQSDFLLKDKNNLFSGIRSSNYCIEGNILVGPDERLYNMLRLDFAGTGKACLLRAGDGPENQEQFAAVVECPFRLEFQA